MGLYKKEVLVRPNSSADFEAAMSWTIDWLTNTFQDVSDNKDADGNYIDYFFADVFFAFGHATNSGQTWRIYTDACEQKYGLQKAASGRIEFMIGDKEGLDNAVSSVENDLSDLQSVVQSNTNRIEALESSEDGVEATVI